MYSKSDGDVVDDIVLVVNVGVEFVNFCGCKYKGLVVDIFGGGIYVCDFF